MRTETCRYSSPVTVKFLLSFFPFLPSFICVYLCSSVDSLSLFSTRATLSTGQDGLRNFHGAPMLALWRNRIARCAVELDGRLSTASRKEKNGHAVRGQSP